MKAEPNLLQGRALPSSPLPSNLPFLHNVSHWKSTNVFPTCLKLGFPGYGAQGAHKVRRILSMNRSAALRCGSMETTSRRAGSESGAPTRLMVPMCVQSWRSRLPTNLILTHTLNLNPFVTKEFRVRAGVGVRVRAGVGVRVRVRVGVRVRVRVGVRERVRVSFRGRAGEGVRTEPNLSRG